jgi:hypothetical protein
MNLKWLTHTALHIVCAVLLLLQAHRIQQIQTAATADHAGMEQRLEGVIGHADECRARLADFGRAWVECANAKNIK